MKTPDIVCIQKRASSGAFSHFVDIGKAALIAALPENFQVVSEKIVYAGFEVKRSEWAAIGTQDSLVPSGESRIGELILHLKWLEQSTIGLVWNFSINADEIVWETRDARILFYSLGFCDGATDSALFSIERRLWQTGVFYSVLISPGS